MATSLISSAFRPFWTPGINEVTGRPELTLPSWLATGDFQVYSAVAKSSFKLTIASPASVIEAFAAECARFTAAAIESIEGIERSQTFPKSAAWLAIRSYYAAFFAAQAILRVVGVSATYVETAQARHIDEVAAIFGMSRGVPVGSGLYICSIDAIAKTLDARRVESKGGSHVVTWKCLLVALRSVNAGVFTTGLLEVDARRVASKLSELEYALTDSGALDTGGWLSGIRNRVNYKLELGVWFPYGERRDYYDQLYSSATQWKKDPLAITIWAKPGRELQRLVDTASMLVGIARELALDLDARCPVGKSVQQFACIPLLNQLAA